MVRSLVDLMASHLPRTRRGVRSPPGAAGRRRRGGACARRPGSAIARSYVHALADRVARGDPDLEALKTADLPTGELV